MYILKPKKENKPMKDKTIKITDSEQSGFYIDNGLTPISIYRSSGELVWEFNKDEQNQLVYKKWCDIKRERMLERFNERHKKEN